MHYYKYRKVSMLKQHAIRLLVNVVGHVELGVMLAIAATVAGVGAGLGTKAFKAINKENN